MPTYEFKCEGCGLLFDVVRSITEFTRDLDCTSCGKKSDLQVSSNRNLFSVSGIPESPQFNPGLGAVTKGTKHAERLAKERGMIPVGNEKVETVNKYFDKVKDDKAKRSWEDI